MNLSEIIASGGGVILLLLTLVEIAPIKVNPWSCFAKVIGKAINGDVLQKLDEIESSSNDTRNKLEAHIKKDDERTADGHRQRILRFNDEIKRGIKHTEEHYNEILEDIDKYKNYCHTHQEYKNSKAVHAISNIERVYDERIEKNDFL